MHTDSPTGPRGQPLIELRCGALRAQLAPGVGGSIAAFWQDAGGPGDAHAPGPARRLHWLRPASAQALAAADPLGMASFPLLPYCNRIRDGRATFEGRSIRLAPNHPAAPSPHPLHGLGWQLPWQAGPVAVDAAELTLQVAASAGWPWAFSASQRVRLRPDGLEVQMRLRNDEPGAAMPAGIGHHPYFQHQPGTRLTTRTGAMWQADAQVMPLALDAGAPAVRALAAGVELQALALDNNFTGWSREALIEWPAGPGGPARRLLMRADAPLDFFVLYCPPGADHFCAEPVSQCTDWLNLLDRHGPADVGGARLEPGQTLLARFELLPATG